MPKNLTFNDDDDTDICPVCDGLCTCDAPRPPLKIKLTVPKSLKPHFSVKRKRGRPPKSSYHNRTKPAPTTIDIDYPTFVSASALQSLASSSDSDSQKASPDDDHVKRVGNHHDWAFADGNPNYTRNNQWVITSRLTEDEADMLVDSESADEDEQEDAERVVDPTGEDDLETHCPLGTSWSEDDDDESSFDADLFFRHLYDSSSSSSADEDSEDSDATRTEESGPLLAQAAAAALPFEVAESWDGGVVFTNGLDGVMGLDWSFDVDAERVGRRRGKKEKGKGRKRKGGKGGKRRELIDHSGDVDMISSDGYLEEDGEFGCDDDQDQDVGFLGFFEASSPTSDFDDTEGTAGEDTPGGGGESGDTTDEDLVGEDMLPNEKAMRMFRFPCSGRTWAVGVGSGSVDPVSLFGRSGDGGRREVLGPLDILNGRAGAGVWEWECSGVGSSEEVSDGKLRGRGRRRKRKVKAQETSPPTPITPVPSTPADSISISTSVGTSEPRKGVFVVSLSSCPPLGSEEKGRAVIGEDQKGADVPSPHPQRKKRRKGGRKGADGSVEVIEQLLRRHLSDSFSAGSTQVGVAHTTDAGPSSPSVLTSPPAPFSGRADRPSEGKLERDVLFELDDVLEASFLNADDEEKVKLEGDGTPSDGHIPDLGGDGGDSSEAEAEAGGDIDLDRDAAAVKNLSRWDVISVGAFRQTQEAQREGGVGERAGHGHGHGHGHDTPRSSVDLGKAMKSSPMSMLWRSGTSGGGGGRQQQRRGLPGSIRKSMSGGSNASGGGGGGGGGNASASGSNGKHAKRRRLMMSAPTMSSPLVLASASASASAGGSRQPSPSNNNNTQTSNTNTNNSKNRKEARRERKLFKRKQGMLGSAPPLSGIASSSSSFSHLHSTHYHHPPHLYHQHQHHPNAKTKGVSSMQRVGSFGSAGLSVLNP